MTAEHLANPTQPNPSRRQRRPCNLKEPIMTCPIDRLPRIPRVFLACGNAIHVNLPDGRQVSIAGTTRADAFVRTCSCITGQAGPAIWDQLVDDLLDCHLLGARDYLRETQGAVGNVLASLGRGDTAAQTIAVFERALPRVPDQISATDAKAPFLAVALAVNEDHLAISNALRAVRQTDATIKAIEAGPCGAAFRASPVRPVMLGLLTELGLEIQIGLAYLGLGGSAADDASSITFRFPGVPEDRDEAYAWALKMTTEWVQDDKRGLDRWLAMHRATVDFFASKVPEVVAGAT